MKTYAIVNIIIGSAIIAYTLHTLNRDNNVDKKRIEDMQIDAMLEYRINGK